MTTPRPPIPQRCWRLDGFLDGAGEPVTADEDRIGWTLGGIYLHVTDPDNPPRFAGFDEQTGDFLTLVWTEVPDPRLATQGGAS